jgi:hypothetical protein
MVKAFIVERLASFETPSDVVAAVKAEFNVVLDRRVMERYDPGKVSSAGLSKRWVDLFHKNRAEYIADIDRIGIRHRADRLRALDRIRRDAEASKNRPLALQAIEMAAKEVGDLFTSRRATEVSGAGGGPVEQAVTFNFKELSDEELADRAIRWYRGTVISRLGKRPEKI